MTKKIPLRNKHGGIVAHTLVDDDDYLNCKVFRWYRQGTGYAVRALPWVDGKTSGTEYLHRRVMDLPLKSDGRVVDHVNKDKLDNRKSNLRVCTQFENLHNSRPRSDGRGFKNASFHRDGVSRPWQSKITYRRRQYSLGYYSTPAEAQAAAEKWRQENVWK